MSERPQNSERELPINQTVDRCGLLEMLNIFAQDNGFCIYNVELPDKPKRRKEIPIMTMSGDYVLKRGRSVEIRVQWCHYPYTHHDWVDIKSGRRLSRGVTTEAVLSFRRDEEWKGAVEGGPRVLESQKNNLRLSGEDELLQKFVTTLAEAAPQSQGI